MDVGDPLKPTTHINTNNLPEDILRLILVFLPVKTLLRFKCVCTNWYALITSTDFIRQHLLLNKNKVNYHCQLFRLCDKSTRKRSFHLLSFNSASQVLTEERVSDPEIDLTAAHEIVGSCDGLICLNVYSNPSRRFIWNPATKQVKPLPVFPESFYQRKHGFATAGIGFGFDSLSNNYKVVWLTNYFYAADGENQFGSDVYVWSLGNDCWREVDTPVPASFTYDVYDKAYTTNKDRGMFSWLCHGYGGCGQVVASYDMSVDVVVTTPLPHSSVIGTFFDRDRLLCSLNECVALLNATKYSMPGGHCDVWVLKNYGFKDSWTKLYTVGPLLDVSRMLGLQKNGDLVVENNHGELISCSSSTQESTVLPFPVGLRGSFRIVSYVESLLPVG